MAGLWCLKILLLWAGIIGLADSSPRTPVTYTVEKKTEMTPMKEQDHLKEDQKKWTASSTPAPPPPQCDYTVVPIKFGLKITLTKGSTAGNYIIKVKEGRLEKETTINRQLSKETSSHDIKHLKPCTAYEHSVAFIDSTGEQTTCNSTGNETLTTPGMKETDIEDVSCIPGYVCYRSEWNIRSSLSTPNNILAVPCQSDRNAICIKPGYNDICSDLKTIFTSGNCVKDSSFIKTKSISVDFLNASEINQMAPTGLPAEIKPTLPPNCDLTVDYTCQENGNPDNTKQLSELEPFTDYSCTGQIKNISDVIITNTPAIKFNIECDIKITDRSTTATNTSIDLSWTTTSENCKDLPNLPKLSYHCSCGTKYSDQRQATVNKHPQGGTCYFTGLKPFTNYNCKVQPTYNNKDVGQSTEIRQKIDVGVPREVTNLRVDLVEHNVIKVTCQRVKDLNGPEEKYIACLNDCHDKNLKQEKNKCEFEFKDLSYLTTYKVKVTVFNGRRESNPVMKVIDTSYNDKALIGSLVFLIILMSVALLFYKIFIRKCCYVKQRNPQADHKFICDINDDMMLKSTVIYVNVQPPGWRHRKAR